MLVVVSVFIICLLLCLRLVKIEASDREEDIKIISQFELFVSVVTSFGPSRNP